jgi:hypothetical protein
MKHSNTIKKLQNNFKKITGKKDDKLNSLKPMIACKLNKGVEQVVVKEPEVDRDRIFKRKTKKWTLID